MSIFKTLILADSLFWFDHAIRIKKTYGNLDQVVSIGVSHKLASALDKNSVATYLDINESHRCEYGKDADILRVDHIRPGQYDSILSLHCTEIFPENLVKDCPCYNLHPGFLPFGRGWHPVSFARATNTPAGATLHRMNGKVDEGPILSQTQVIFDFDDTCGDVHLQVREAEVGLLKKYERGFVTGMLGELTHIQQPATYEPTHTKKDFEDLCNIPIDKKMAVGELIDLLAALTYAPDESHAYVMDGTEKIKIGIFMERVDG